MRNFMLCTVVLAVLLPALVSRAGEKPDLLRPLPDDPNLAVDTLLEEDLDASAWFSPMGATNRGDHRFDDRLPDITYEGFRARMFDLRTRSGKIRSIEPDALDETHRLNAELLRYELTDRIRMLGFRDDRMPINQLNGPHIEFPSFALRLNLSNTAQREDYIKRLRQLPAYFDQTIANMRGGLEQERTPPKITLTQVPAQTFQHAQEKFLANPREHVMFTPLRDLPEDDPLAVEAAQLITDEIVPAFKKLGEFLRDEYIPNCRESIGAADLPQGQRYYATQLAHYTSTKLRASEIHKIGKEEVTRIRAEMFDTIARSDFAKNSELEGDELFEAFTTYLRTDPRFYAESKEELLNIYRVVAKKMDQHMPELFGTLPRLSYGVEEMPQYMQSAGPNAYYMFGSLENGVAGTFVVNTYQLDQRPTYEKIALCLHEAVPGHHHQHSLAREAQEQGLHEWRTTLSYNAFGEGWALYAERLGLEVGSDPKFGLYADPYDDFGRLSYEMWRALRLVVDTGMHAFGWTRQEAIDYMLENSALSQTNVEREVDRYIAWPGQACGYKLGELSIRKLRQEAQEVLGDSFDIRAFHDAILVEGSLPLDVFERQMRAWIDAQQVE
jgi:uncharacterized protein (DUF885 family)